MTKDRKRPQDVASENLARARKRVAENEKLAKHYDRLALLARVRVRSWEAKATRYARRASMTDAEVEAERAKRQERKSLTVRRAIAIGGPR